MTLMGRFDGKIIFILRPLQHLILSLLVNLYTLRNTLKSNTFTICNCLIFRFGNGIYTFRNCLQRIWGTHLSSVWLRLRGRAHILAFIDGTCSTPEACACHHYGPHKFLSQLHFARPCKRAYSLAPASHCASTSHSRVCRLSRKFI